MKEVLEFYEENKNEIEEMYFNYITEKHWGSGNDNIKLTEEIFWQFVENLYEKQFDFKIN